MTYTYRFSGEVTVEAKSEKEAYDLVDELVAPTRYAVEHSENITVDDIELIDED